MDTDVHHSGAPTDTTVAPPDMKNNASKIPKRTRSQSAAPNEVSRIPLARSPLKHARAQARALARATLSHKRSQSHTRRHRQDAEPEAALRSEGVGSEGLQETIQTTEETEAGVIAEAQGRMEEREGGGGDDSARISAESWDGDPHSCTGTAGAKKRASPDTESARLASPSAERTPKRAKLEMALPSKPEKVATPTREYNVPLRDTDDTSPKHHTRPFVRASSVVSPSKSTTIFPPRAKSVPLEGDDIALPLDLAAIPPSPRRSPNKVEIRRAPSQPPPDEDSMEVDNESSFSALSHFTNLALFSPRKTPAFNYTVNFATPVTVDRRMDHPQLTPLSPLTPLPPTPPQKCSTSSSTFVAPPTKSLKQTSLLAFLGVKPNIPSTLTVASSAKHSPSKIPIPVSPPRHTPRKPRSFTLSSTTATTNIDIFGRTSRSGALSTLSHALEKLSVPPPSRPNTSLGFLREGGTEDDQDASDKELNVGEEGTATGKGKGKARAVVNPVPSSSTGMNGRGASSFARPTASSLRRVATISGPIGVHASSNTGRRRVTRIFGRSGERASKNPTLPTVEGSPVKGFPLVEPKVTIIEGEMDASGSTDVTSDVTRQDPNVSAASSSSLDKGMQHGANPPCSHTLNPASAALHALSTTLSSLQQTPPKTKPKAVGTRSGLRSAMSSDPSSGVDSCSGSRKTSLKVLKKCTIFVDVRTDQGDDAGSLFVDMLRGLGAKIISRISQSCTHIVFKNGLPTTLARYRVLNDPKPHVVGIAWVVECVEQRARMDEEKYRVDVELINVAGGNKRRRSMLPRIPYSPAPDTFSLPINLSSEGDEDTSTKVVEASPSDDADISVISRDDDNLPPLERARRRRSILPGGQTKLFGS